MNEPTLLYNDESSVQKFNDGAGSEAHYVFALSDIAELVANYGPNKVMTDLYQSHPEIYAALCVHFYKDFYKLQATKDNVPDMRVLQ